MAENQGKPVGGEWDYSPGELADRLGTPTADVREFMTDADRPIELEPTNEEGMVERDADGYVGPDGRMMPHQGPGDVPLRIDPELDSPELDAAARRDIEDVEGIWEGR